MSHISMILYLKLIFRSCLLIGTTVIYSINRIQGSEQLFFGAQKRPFILFLIWIIFVIEMIFRFFPSRFESMGCQKQFKQNFKPRKEGQEKVNLQPDRSILWVAIFWLVLNGVIGTLYGMGLIDDGILILISLLYSVCDMICILFFCPFQTWIMKNKCCTSCRIYNWDYAMMFTPLVFIKDLFVFSIFVFAMILLVRWEITAFMHPERFSEETNACLSCSCCREKLCHHKKQLRHFLNVNKKRFYSKERE